MRILGLTSETRVVMPRTVMSLPKCSPRTCRTASDFLAASPAVGVTGLKFKVYLLVNSGGNVDTGTAASGSASLAESTVSFLRALCASIISTTSSLKLNPSQESCTRHRCSLDVDLRDLLAGLRHCLVDGVREEVNVVFGVFGNGLNQSQILFVA